MAAATALAGISTARAEDPLAQLVLEGVVSAFPVKIQELRLEQSALRRSISYFSLLPTVTLSGGKSVGTADSVPDDTRVTSPFTNANLSVNASWTLWNNYQNIRDNQTARLAYQAERANSKSTVQGYVESVLDAYFKLQLLRHQREVIEETLEHTRATATQSEELAKAGLKTPLDQLDSKVQVATGERDLLEAKNAILAAERALRALINSDQVKDIPPFDLINAQPYYMDGFDGKLTEIKATWETRIAEANPAFKAAAIRLEQSEAQLAQTKLNYLPQTSLVVSHQVNLGGYVQPFTTPPNQIALHSSTVALAFTWQVWDWFNTPRYIGVAARDHEANALSLKDSLTRNAADMQNQIDQYEILRKSIEVSRLVVQTAREQLDYSLELYKLGRINILSVQTANERFSQARIDLATRIRDRFILAALLLQQMGYNLLPENKSLPWLGEG